MRACPFEQWGVRYLFEFELSYTALRRGQLPVCTVVFPDAGRLKDIDNDQLVSVCAFVVGGIECCSAFHSHSWAFRKSRRSLKYVGDAEPFATGSSIDDCEFANANIYVFHYLYRIGSFLLTYKISANPCRHVRLTRANVFGLTSNNEI